MDVNMRRAVGALRLAESRGSFMLKKIATLGLTLVLAMTAVHGRRQDGQDVRQRIVRARALDLGGLGLARPAGLAYSSTDDRFILLEADRSGAAVPGGARIGMLTRRGETAGIRRLQLGAIGPACVAYDDLTRSLYLLENDGDLVQIEMRDGSPQPAAVERLSMAAMGLRQPRGLAFDAATGSLFILDGGTSSILRVSRSAPDEAGHRGAAAAIAAGLVSRIDLGQAGLADLRGVAVNPDGSRIYTLSGAARKLYEVTPGGEVVAAHDLSGLGLTDPQTLVLAPSGDPTDDPAQQSLYLLDGARGGAGSDAGGSVVELYVLSSDQLIQAETVLASVESFQSTVVRTTDTSRFSPPSPDPSGVAYMAPFGRLMIADGEVDEMPIFAGVNRFEVTPAGNLVATSSTTAFSIEPVGAAFNPSNSHLFISDDDADRIFEIDPRGDGLFGTGDDVVTSISTLAFGSDDPEGLAYDSLRGYLYVADGEGREVYEVRPGPDDRFNGVPPAGDDQVSHFDLFVMGLLDTEGIEHNPDLDRLYIVDRGTKTVVETTTTGTLLRTIDISSADPVVPAGLAYGPSSVNPTERSLYIVDRGLDNDSHPTENDGKMYEMTLPGPPPPPPAAPSNLAATAASSSRIDLTWQDNAVNESGFRIERCAGSACTNFSQVATASANVTGHADTTLAASTTYRYRVVADNAGGASSYSNVASATTAAPPTPGSVLFQDNFEDGVEDGWSEASGAWSVVSSGSKVYQQSSAAGDGIASAGETVWGDYTVEARIKPVSFNAAGGFVRLIGRFRDVSNYYYLLLRSTQVLELKKLAGGTATTLSSKAFTVSPGGWYTLKLELVGTSLKAYVNGQLELSATDSQFNGGRIAVGSFNASGEVDDVVVQAPGSAPDTTPPAAPTGLRVTAP